MPLENIFLVLALLAFGYVGWQLRGYFEDWHTEWEIDDSEDEDE